MKKEGVDSPYEEFKIMVIKMFTEVRRTIHKVRISTKTQKIRKNQAENRVEECNN